MSTKKTMLEMPKHLAVKAIGKTKKAVSTANDYALNTTEVAVTEGIVLAEQWQVVANKAIKNGLKLSDTNQDIVFSALNGVKKHVMLSKKRFLKLIA